MKCEATKNLVLLDQSGELSAFGRRRLARHLAACPDCRQFRDELARITTATRSAAEDTVSAVTLERIRVAARKAGSRSEEIRFRPSRQPWTEMWQPALLYSTLGVALAIGFVLIMRPYFHPGADLAAVRPPATAESSDWDSGLDDQISLLDEQVANVPDEWATDSDDVDSMARELLALEEQKI
jgi:hypothetical protein